MSKQYHIVVNYDTGNSFGRDPDQEEDVWENDDHAIAKENADRIKRQQKLYDLQESFEYRRHINAKKIENHPDYNLPYILKEDPKIGRYGWKVLLLDDERQEHEVYTGTWQGYFESFNYVEVRIEPYRP